MLGIKDALRKIYSGEDVLQKHVILFGLSGFTAIASTLMNGLSKNKQIPTSDVVFIIVTAIVLLAISFYLNGYFLKFINKSYDELNENIMPEFDFSLFKIFFKALPLYIVWGLYLIIAGLVVSFLGIVGKILLILLCVMSVFVIPMMISMFSKNFERKGLYNPLNVLKVVLNSFMDIVWLFVRILPLIVFAIVVNMLGVLGNNVLTYLLAATGSYLTAIMQYCLHFGFVQIIKKNEQN